MMKKLELKLENLHSYYGTSHILQGISLQINRGELVYLLGRNGAGKTTTMKSIMGIVRPKDGSITYEGIPITRMKPFSIAKLGIGYVPEDARIYPEFTVMENLIIGRKSQWEGGWNIETVIGLLPKLEELKKRMGNQLSGGERQMLTIARTLMGNPSLLLLDEPSQGLAPLVVSSLAEALLDLKEGGLSILLSEQNARFARKLADRGYVIDNGRIVFSGTVDELMQDEEILRRHLLI